MRYVLAAYCLAFDNARVERQTINTGRRRRRFSRLSGLISRLPCLGVLPYFHASIVRLTFETRKPMISAAPRTVAKLLLFASSLIAAAAPIMVAMRLKTGQPVLIKRFLVGTVLEDRPGDGELPLEDRGYMVSVSEDKFAFRPRDLEPLAESTNALTKFSPEWSAEFSRWLEAGKRFSTDEADRKAWDEFSAAGSKLGFFIPIKEE